VNGCPGMIVLQVAEEKGVYIPALCHDLHLRSVSVCRVCPARDQRAGMHAASCVTPTAHRTRDYYAVHKGTGGIEIRG